MSEIPRGLRLYRKIQMARILCARAPEPPPEWKWTGSHRRPPLPFYGLKAEPGRCRICWLPIYTGGAPSGDVLAKRSTWHAACASAHLFWMTPTVTVAGRHQGFLCAECGHGSGTYWLDVEVDHTIPLYRVRRDYAREPWYQLLRFWSPENLKVLCRDCHKQKCAHEANERSQFVKQLDQPLLL